MKTFSAIATILPILFAFSEAQASHCRAWDRGLRGPQYFKASTRDRCYEKTQDYLLYDSDKGGVCLYNGTRICAVSKAEAAAAKSPPSSGASDSYVAASPSPARPPSNGERGSYVPAGYTLVYSDEFDSLSLNTGWRDEGKDWYAYWAAWNVRHLANNRDEAVKVADGTQVANGRTAYHNLRRASGLPAKDRYLHRVSKGVLSLYAYEIPRSLHSAFWDFPYVGAMIAGQGDHAMKYGYWETRVRAANVSKGHHITVWLAPAKGGARSSEIDLLEIVGQSPAKFHANSHGETEELYISWKTVSNPKDWHVIGFEWTPDTMIWTLNGKTLRQHPNYIDDKKLDFMISWEVGGKWPGDPDGTTVWPARFDVDYVRMYKK